MTKWKCINEECGGKCKIYTEKVPLNCIIDDECAEWEKDTDEPTTNCNHLPDWCKPDKIVWIDPTKEPLSRGYMEILFIEGKTLILETGSIDFQPEIIKKTRLRRWLPEEAIGKIVIINEIYYVIAGADKELAWLCHYCIKLDDLQKKGKQPDGKPCGVLEHLEDGEWVP